MESLSELYEERAAIKQYDGNMSKQQAEQEAAKEIYGATRSGSVQSKQGLQRSGE